MQGFEERLDSDSLAFVEGLYTDYLRDPESVSPDWRSYFENAFRSQGALPAIGAEPLSNGFSNGISNGTYGTNGYAPGDTAIAESNGHQSSSSQRQMELAVLQDRVDQLIRAFRVRGHLIASLDPLGFPRPQLPELDPAYYGFSDADLERVFSTDTIEGPQQMSLRRIVDRLRNTYCRSIGVQFMHIDELRVRHWLQVRMEGSENRCFLTRDEQLKILRRLTNATVFEEFIQKRFLGAKSFSLEGAESLIPLLELTIEKAGEHQVDEIVLGMAHRGRLNVLANIMGKSAQQIFREFSDIDPELHLGRGDVKYHLGYSNDWHCANGHKIHLSLCFNPSHLEFVNTVAVGRIRAKMDRAEDLNRQHGLCILIHGDAAFAGEGIVQETLNLSQLEGYRIGGTLHVVVNNQIGFTTDPSEARSSTYATDIAKMLQIPIFHVNGEDPEAVAQCVRLALDFRREFQRDVVIDMYCYRRRGHNETDEPEFTQPALYRAIKQRKPVREGYVEHLLKMQEVSHEEADHMVDDERARLDTELNVAKSEEYVRRTDIAGFWSFYVGGREREAAEVDTGLEKSQISELLLKLVDVPPGFTPHKKLQNLLDARREMALGNKPLDWGAGEMLGFASIAAQGLRIRMTGQDAERGTFSHRHAVLHDFENGQRHMSLKHLAPDQAPVEIYNSPLSEMGVLGFEYGYSVDCPDGLVIWEAQFGDFVNCAQVIIDQFIVSAEDKWNRLSGLVMLLPHAFEGQGPEHSSARLERFLSLAAKDNIQICNLTTPAQYFHCLRRQVLRVWRKPLIIMTPKSLLRHPKAVSSLDELATGSFQRVIPDTSVTDARKVERVLLCSGKIYYELLQRREESKRTDVAIIRIEQYYPLPKEQLRAALNQFSDGTPVYWVQEEPENMGAWRFWRIHLAERLFDRFPFSGIYRQSAASPATGSGNAHKLEQEKLLSAAFGDV